jgi:hypothetical protein
VMSDALYRDPELVVLTELCRALAGLGVSVGLADARPAVVIRSPEPFWITVGPSGKFFEWHEAQHRHSVTDPDGAAALVADQVKTQHSGLGGAS